MYVRVNNKLKELSIINRDTGIEWTVDLISNSDPSALKVNKERNEYEMSEEDYDYWFNIIDGLNEIEDLKKFAKDELSEEEYDNLIFRLDDAADANELEMQIDNQKKILYEVLNIE